MNRAFALGLLTAVSSAAQPLWLTWDPPTNNTRVTSYTIYQVYPTNTPAVRLGITTNRHWKVESLPQTGAITWLVAANNGPIEGPHMEIHFDPATSRPGPVQKLASVTNLVINGGFEAGAKGWTFSGHVIPFTTKDVGNVYGPAEGERAVTFNAGNTSPNGVVRQTINTLPGKDYAITFAAGIVAFQSHVQLLKVTVKGQANLLAESISIDTSGANPFAYRNYRFTFTADSAKTEIAFQDGSTDTDQVDLLLDAVAVFPSDLDGPSEPGVK